MFEIHRQDKKIDCRGHSSDYFRAFFIREVIISLLMNELRMEATPASNQSLVLNTFCLNKFFKPQFFHPQRFTDLKPEVSLRQ